MHLKDYLVFSGFLALRWNNSPRRLASGSASDSFFSLMLTRDFWFLILSDIGFLEEKVDRVLVD